MAFNDNTGDDTKREGINSHAHDIVFQNIWISEPVGSKTALNQRLSPNIAVNKLLVVLLAVQRHN